MARGASIIVSSPPRGVFIEGIIGDTSKPGTIMQIQGGTACAVGGFTYIAANVGTDGKCVCHQVLLADSLQGKLATDAYVSGTKCFLYIPSPGEDVNVLLGEVAGTGNTYAIGDRLIIDAEDGVLVPESGSPQETSWICLETLTQVAGSHLTWCRKM